MRSLKYEGSRLLEIEKKKDELKENMKYDGRDIGNRIKKLKNSLMYLDIILRIWCLQNKKGSPKNGTTEQIKF